MLIKTKQGALPN